MSKKYPINRALKDYGTRLNQHSKHDVCIGIDDPSTCAFVEYSDWLDEHVGLNRGAHPSHDLVTDSLYLGCGSWALALRRSMTHKLYWCFWISKDAARVHFRLRFGGQMGNDIEWNIG